MKIGKMEGTPEEITGFIQNNGLRAEDYLERAEPSVKTVCFLIPVFLVVSAFAFLTLAASPSLSVRTFAFLVGCAAGFWLAVNVQIRFKSTWAALFAAVGTVLIMLVALGVLAPMDLLQHLKDINQ